ncbi:hypothetical protein E5Q_06100 [Mixia osmundae IAM 14324]|uniref:Putative zinc-finger domain-containing protein n=1 Tax=Mixia osmundae (strain CBS 9802 / IAM 14324 / JCM 22182 / KY 12970) TaxID=764103 RepID=G7E9T3_MIXOS|nr:hypothetical protein E5Q_06100 [Mixia osmundae IAM 14324]
MLAALGLPARPQPFWETPPEPVRVAKPRDEGEEPEEGEIDDGEVDEGEMPSRPLAPMRSLPPAPLPQRLPPPPHRASQFAQASEQTKWLPPPRVALPPRPLVVPPPPEAVSSALPLSQMSRTDTSPLPTPPPPPIGLPAPVWADGSNVAGQPKPMAPANAAAVLASLSLREQDRIQQFIAIIRRLLPFGLSATALQSEGISLDLVRNMHDVVGEPMPAQLLQPAGRHRARPPTSQDTSMINGKALTRDPRTPRTNKITAPMVIDLTLSASTVSHEQEISSPVSLDRPAPAVHGLPMRPVYSELRTPLTASSTTSQHHLREAEHNQLFAPQPRTPASVIQATYPVGGDRQAFYEGEVDDLDGIAYDDFASFSPPPAPKIGLPAYIDEGALENEARKKEEVRLRLQARRAERRARVVSTDQAEHAERARQMALQFEQNFEQSLSMEMFAAESRSGSAISSGDGMVVEEDIAPSSLREAAALAANEDLPGSPGFEEISMPRSRELSHEPARAQTMRHKVPSAAAPYQQAYAAAPNNSWRRRPVAADLYTAPAQNLRDYKRCSCFGVCAHSLVIDVSDEESDGQEDLPDTRMSAQERIEANMNALRARIAEMEAAQKKLDEVQAVASTAPRRSAGNEAAEGHRPDTVIHQRQASLAESLANAKSDVQTLSEAIEKKQRPKSNKRKHLSPDTSKGTLARDRTSRSPEASTKEFQFFTRAGAAEAADASAAEAGLLLLTASTAANQSVQRTSSPASFVNESPFQAYFGLRSVVKNTTPLPPFNGPNNLRLYRAWSAIERGFDPSESFCSYESSGGVCNDTGCKHNHTRNFDLDSTLLTRYLQEQYGVMDQVSKAKRTMLARTLDLLGSRPYDRSVNFADFLKEVLQGADESYELAQRPAPLRAVHPCSSATLPEIQVVPESTRNTHRSVVHGMRVFYYSARDQDYHEHNAEHVIPPVPPLLEMVTVYGYVGTLAVGLGIITWLAIRDMISIPAFKGRKLQLSVSANHLNTIDLVTVMSRIAKKSLPWPFSNAAELKPNAARTGYDLPEVTIEAPFKIHPRDLKRFQAAVSLSDGSQKSQTDELSPFIFVSLTTPFFLLLLTNEQWPISALGAVNTSNTFNFIRPERVRTLEQIQQGDFFVRAQMGGDDLPGVRAKRGIQWAMSITLFERDGGKEVEIFNAKFEVLKFLSRSAKPAYNPDNDKKPGELDPAELQDSPQKLKLTSASPRVYSASSLDYNPIHLHPLTAYFLTGKQIAHGNLSVLAFVHQISKSADPADAALKSLWRVDRPMTTTVRFTSMMPVPCTLDSKISRKADQTGELAFQILLKNKVCIAGSAVPL